MKIHAQSFLFFLFNKPVFFKAMTMAKVAKYVNATSITEIRPNSCFVGKNQSG